MNYSQDEAFKNALAALLWYGGLQVLIGVLVYIFAKDYDLTTRIVPLIVSGTTFLGLYWWARGGTKLPLWIGLVVTLLVVVTTIAMGSFRGSIVGAIVIYRLWQGTQAEGVSTTKYTGDDAPLDSGI